MGIARNLFLIAALCGPAADPARGGVFINEIDYDSEGVDLFEWIELAGPAGLALDDFELLFIDQLGHVYNTLDLAYAGFTLEDETGTGWGFFVLGRVAPEAGPAADYTPSPWSTNEVENGPRDSIQLRQKAGSVNLHLVDYEGNNPWTAEDEMTELADSNDDRARSLYKTGQGMSFEDFVFASESGASSPGALNDGQVLLPALSAAVPASRQATTGLLLNVPNPFHDDTGIAFDLPRRSSVEIAVYDALGRRARSWPGVTLPAGPHQVAWDGCDDAGRHLSAGAYFCELVVDGAVAGWNRVILLH